MHGVPKLLAQLWIFRYHLGNNIHGSCQGVPGRIYFQLRVDKFCGDCLRRALGILLQEDAAGQGLQALFLRLLGPGALFLLVWKVNVFQLLQLGGFFDGGLQLICQLALLVDFGNDFLLPLDEVSQVGKPFLNSAQLLVFQLAGGFLSVPGDKRHGIAIIQKLYGGINLCPAHLQFPGNYGINIFNQHIHSPKIMIFVIIT